MFYIFLFIIGCCIGSFLNVCIYRIPEHISIVTPRSFCPNCKRQIKTKDNIPILSYILLRGRCRYCKEYISVQYPIVEGITGMMLVILFYQFGMSKYFGIYSLLFVALVVVFAVDIKTMIIPDRITIPGVIVGIIFSLVLRHIPVKDSLFGILGGAGFFIVVAVLGRLIYKKDVMGFGDVKLAGMLGSFLGWRSLIVTIFLSLLLGSIFGILFCLITKRSLKTIIPFGPFLSVSAMLTIFFRERFLGLYGLV